MSVRRRWQPVRGYGNRVYEPWERLVTLGVDLPSRAWTLARGHRARVAPPLAGEDPQRVLVLRLDRIGDVVMSLSALSALRSRLPRAHVTLAVGSWAMEIARSAPVDEVLEWNAPWVGRGVEGRDGWRRLLREAWRLRSRRLDLGIDFQGDPRAALLLRLTGARGRVGYANAGGEALLTHVVPLDETLSWPEQNLLAVRRALGDTPDGGFPSLVSDAEIAAARERLPQARAPWVGIHPSGGRRVKEWPADRWSAVGRELLAQCGGSVIVTGSHDDRPLAQAIVAALGGSNTWDLTGELTLRQTLGVIAACDVFLSADTGPMHLAQALGTPSVSVFGPSDPARYITSRDASRHVIVRPSLWCSPCNLIRRPPRECQDRVPECLERVSVSEVVASATTLLTRRV